MKTPSEYLPVPEEMAKPDLKARLLLRRFDVARIIKPSIPRFWIGGTPISTPGNISAISAVSKGGKSSFIGAMEGAAISGGGDACLSIRSQNETGGALIVLDTEQCEQDHDEQSRRALSRAGVSKAPDWLHSYCITGFSVDDSQAALRMLLSDCKREHGSIHSVLIDGAADMVLDVNDAAECNAFVAQLHALAIEYLCSIIGVIHLNPGSEKTRGHLGSQLERKSESNIRLEKDGDAIICWAEKNRKAPIPKDRGPRFVWSNDAGMHVLTESADAAKLDAERELLKSEAESVFLRACKSTLKWGEFLTSLMAECNLKEGGARKRFDKMVRAQVVTKEMLGLYTLTK